MFDGNYDISTRIIELVAIVVVVLPVLGVVQCSSPMVSTTTVGGTIGYYDSTTQRCSSMLSFNGFNA
jgi:hypothetical protein